MGTRVKMNALAAARLPHLLSAQPTAAYTTHAVPRFLRDARAASFWSALKAWTSPGHAAETRSEHGHTWTDENRCGRFTRVPGNAVAPPLRHLRVRVWTPLALLAVLPSLSPCAHSRSAFPGSWMERGGPEFARHLERERSHYLREMAWSRQLQRRLRDEISARLPDSVARRTSVAAHCPLPMPSQVGSPSLQHMLRFLSRALPAARFVCGCTPCSSGRRTGSLQSSVASAGNQH